MKERINYSVLKIEWHLDIFFNCLYFLFLNDIITKSNKFKSSFYL